MIDKLPTNNINNSSPHKTSMNYQLLVVNSTIIGAVFIFFAIAAQVPTSTIFTLNINKCTFGFNLTAQDAQIGVAMVGGILILLLSISSVLLLLGRSTEAIISTLTAFAVVFVAAIIIVLSLSCRLPVRFVIEMMLVPFVTIIIVITGVYIYLKRKQVRDKV